MLMADLMKVINRRTLIPVLNTFITTAWRALGPSIEDEFDTLDDRYVKLNATSVVGNLYRLRGPMLQGPDIYSFNQY